jgi:hypothetical protein
MTKNDDGGIVFSVHRTGGSSSGPDPENRVYKDVSSELQVTGVPEHFHARIRPPWSNSGGGFLQSSFNCTSKDK